MITSNHMHVVAGLHLIAHNMPKLHATATFSHTQTHTHLLSAKQFHPLLRSRCRDMILPSPHSHADTHACTQTQTHTHTQVHAHGHTHAYLQRQSREAEVTGPWFHAILSKCSANCHSPTVREQCGSNRVHMDPGMESSAAHRT